MSDRDIHIEAAAEHIACALLKSKDPEGLHVSITVDPQGIYDEVNLLVDKLYAKYNPEPLATPPEGKGL